MLFSPRSSDRYDGIVSATFENGHVSSIRMNAITDQRWDIFLTELIRQMSETYPDSGSCGLSVICETNFEQSARNIFWKTLELSGITNDRDAVAKCADKQTVINFVKMLKELILND